MRVQLMQSYLENTSTALSLMREMIQTRVQSSHGDGGDDDDDGIDEQDAQRDLIRKIDQLVGAARTAKMVVSKAARSLDELRARCLSLEPDTLPFIEHCQRAAEELKDFARELGGRLLEHLYADDDDDDNNGNDAGQQQQQQPQGLAAARTLRSVQQLVRQATAACFAVEEGSALSVCGDKLRALTAELGNLGLLAGDLTRTAEFERGALPWTLRARALRAAERMPAAAAEQLHVLKEALVESARQLRLRERALDEAGVREELLEARARDAAQRADKAAALERTVLDARRREQGLEQALEARSRDLQAIQAELDAARRKHKKGGASRLKNARDRATADGGESELEDAYDDDAYDFEEGDYNEYGEERVEEGDDDDDDDGDDGLGDGRRGWSGRGPAKKRRRQRRAAAAATARSLELLRAEIRALQGAVRYLREENHRLREGGLGVTATAIAAATAATATSTTSTTTTTATATISGGSMRTGWREHYAQMLLEPLPFSYTTAAAAAAAGSSAAEKSLVRSETKDALLHLLQLAGEARVYDMRAAAAAAPAAAAAAAGAAGGKTTTEGKADADAGAPAQPATYTRLRWRPQRTTPQWHVSQQREQLERWREWCDDILARGAAASRQQQQQPQEAPLRPPQPPQQPQQKQSEQTHSTPPPPPGNVPAALPLRPSAAPPPPLPPPSTPGAPPPRSRPSAPRAGVKWTDFLPGKPLSSATSTTSITSPAIVGDDADDDDDGGVTSE
jgi:hypothetical protein